jgi:dihydroflavonol-4-reductase
VERDARSAGRRKRLPKHRMVEQRRILVTGGTGFVGSHVVDALLGAGLRPRCLVRATSNLRWLEGKPVELAYADLRAGQLGPVVDGIDAVIHCAGLTRGSREALMSANRDGTRALVEACFSTGRNIRFVLCSSQAAAGPGTLARPRQESDPAAPTSDYGASKLAGETAVLRSGNDLDAVVLRPVTVYGPRDEDTLTFFKLAARGIIPAPGLRKRLMQLVHVSDLASALIKALDLPEVSGRIYFVAHPEVIDWDQLAAAMSEAVGRRAVVVRVPTSALRMVGAVAGLFGSGGRAGQIDRRKAADMSERAWTCNVDRALEELDWSPAYDVRGGFRDSADWYRQEGWL